MRPASLQPQVAPSGAPILHRSGSLLLAVSIHLLLLFLLLRLAPPLEPPVPTTPITVRLVPEGTESPARTEADEAEPAQGSPAKPAPAPPAPTVPTEVPPVPSSSQIWSQVLPMTRQEFAAADIARMPAPSAAPGGESGSGTALALNSGDSAGVGKGPNGETLYNAQWYRRPTSAELAFYLRPGTPSIGWGMIACRTVPDYRVDDCQELGQSPAGSGLAGAVRQAAWQFRVVPPRIGGRPLVGAWVRIRIDYTSKGARVNT